MLKNYNITSDGVIHQTEHTPYTYDVKYVEDRYVNIPQLTKLMSCIRLSYLRSALAGDGVTSVTGKKILDVGYGAGDFLSECRDFNMLAYGTDISGFPVPRGVQFLNWGDVMRTEFDVVCFFDSLEHFSDLSDVGKLNTKYVYISLPWCHARELGDEWFYNWKHRREGEHLHHFDEPALVEFFRACGYVKINTSDVEDILRKPTTKHPNILSGVFKKIVK